MRVTKVAVVLVGVALSLATGSADGRPAPRAPSLAGAPRAKQPIAHSLAGVTWGQSSMEVAAAIHAILADDYRPRLAAATPGPATEAIEIQLGHDSDRYRHSQEYCRFVAPDVDETPACGEYQAQVMFTLVRGGVTFRLFFSGDRLWKIVEEHPLGGAGSLGATYDAVIAQQATVYGVRGRTTSAVRSKSAAVEVDWRDAKTHLRVIERDDGSFDLAYEDSATLTTFAKLRACPSSRSRPGDIMDPFAPRAAAQPCATRSRGRP